MEHDLGNGLTIKPDTPETHVKPEFCRKCRTFYYFGGHFCTEKHEKNDSYKRAMQGYYDGE